VVNLYVWAMRTLVPYGVGLALTAGGWLGIPIDSQAAAGAVSIGLAAAYCTLLRALEELGGRMGWRPLELVAGIMLGWARPPVYEKPAVMPVRLKLDRQAMGEDIDAFVRMMGDKLGSPGEGGGGR
jgi:hypothetical protein